MKKIFFTFKVICFWVLLLLPSFAKANSPIYKIGIETEDRFTIKNSDGTYSGFEIDLWQEIAKSLNIQFEFKEISSFKDLLDELKDGKIDIAMASITMNYERSQYVDFSYPYFVTSLGILTKENEHNSLIKVVKPLFTPIVGKTIILFLVVMFIFGNILWFTEQGKHSFISRNYFPGIFQAMWCTFAIQSTIGFGDIIPRRWIARVLSIPIWIFGIFMVAIITAQLLTAYTNEQNLSPIKTYHDLRGKVVATVADTTSVKVLDSLDVREVILVQDNLIGLYPKVSKGEIDALVLDYPYLASMANFLKKEGKRPYLVPNQFAQQMYSIALNKKLSSSNPPLLEEINKTILQFKDNGYIDHLKVKWFGDLGIR